MRKCEKNIKKNIINLKEEDNARKDKKLKKKEGIINDKW